MDMKQFVGQWRIVEMEVWNQDYVDMDDLMVEYGFAED